MTDPLRAKAEAIAADLMDNGTGIPTHRLLLVDNRHRGCGGGWSYESLTNRIYKHLLEMEERKS